MRRLLTLQSILLSWLAVSCSGVGGGTFPGVVEEPRRVTLNELAAYYHAHSDGAIQLNVSDSLLYFVWDPYLKHRIYPSTIVKVDVLQRLFTFDPVRFVEQSGAPDFVSAARAFYQRQSYDKRRQTYTRPYRYLSAWGSLFHPPMKILTEPLQFYHAQFSESFDSRSVSSRYFDPAFQEQLDLETGTELTYGNELRALFNGVESFPEKLRLTSQARKFLYVAVMTIVADASGRELLRNMVNLKRAGVDVRLITEGFYTLSISNYAVGMLEREGIPVVRVDDKTLSQLNRMFHNKIWIKDGDEAILG
ncbi:MAG TPA: phospholipase D-like domain-containing protein, partial [Bacteroidota bacterium]|nr:phospholipase D-like domain-containing protein [Bacteroidota bacterium]